MSDDNQYRYSLSIRGFDKFGFNPIFTVRSDEIGDLIGRYGEALALLDEIGLSAEPSVDGANKIVEFDAYAVGEQEGKKYFMLYSQEPGWSIFATTVWPERMQDMPFAPTGNETIAASPLKREVMANSRLLSKFPKPVRLKFMPRLDDEGNVIKNEKGYIEWDKRTWVLVSPVLSPEQESKRGKQAPDADAEYMQAYPKIVAGLERGDPYAFRMLAWTRQHWQKKPSVPIKAWAKFMDSINAFFEDASAAEAIFAVLAGCEIDQISGNAPSQEVFDVLKKWSEKEEINGAFRQIQLNYQMNPEIE